MNIEPLRRALRLSLLFLCASSSLPTLAQSNLLTNAGAEFGDTSGWVDALGNGFNVSSVTTFNGNFSFTAGLGGPTGAWNHELRQDVDVTSDAPMIDAGSVTSVFACVGRTNEAGGAIDPGRTRVEFLASGGALLASYDTGVFAPSNAWHGYSDTRVVPAGTRTIRVRLIGSRAVGASTDCFFDELELRLECGSGTYCTAKTNSQGCVPSASVTGTASLTSSTLVVGASQVLNQKSGLLFYGFTSSAAPFQGGTLCVAPPTVRTPVQNSGGAPSGVDCSGAYSFAFTSSFLVSASLGNGDDVYCQFWSRDPASPSTTGLTNAARFRVCP